MKKCMLLSLVLSLCLLACQNDKKEAQSKEENAQKEEVIPTVSDSKIGYPAKMASVFNAHGGLDRWAEMNNLCFQFEGKGGVETHTISLKDRRSKIETKNWSIGNDGSDVWLLQNTKDAYQGNARFYHNLYFYFYAMPFVLADDGIRYESVEATELDGNLYEGIKISYNEGVGDAPDDEYVLYFHPETHRMEWLGYTVTYQSNEKSDSWHYIKYSKWEEVNGLLLPKKLTWYDTENGIPTKPRNSKDFSKITITETILDASVFAKPMDAEVLKR